MKNADQTATSHSCFLLVIRRDSTLSSKECMERKDTQTPSVVANQPSAIHSFGFHTSSFSSSLEESERSRDTEASCMNTGHMRLWKPSRILQSKQKSCDDNGVFKISSPVRPEPLHLFNPHILLKTITWSPWITNIWDPPAAVNRGQNPDVFQKTLTGLTVETEQVNERAAPIILPRAHTLNMPDTQHQLLNVCVFQMLRPEIQSCTFSKFMQTIIIQTN